MDVVFTFIYSCMISAIPNRDIALCVIIDIYIHATAVSLALSCF